MTIAALVAQTMKATGLSARALARILEIDERTMRRWQSGHREMPGPARQLCRLLVNDPALVKTLEAFLEPS